MLKIEELPSNTQDEDCIQFEKSCQKAEKFASKLISRAEQNRAKLTAKLRLRGFDAAVAETVISRLSDQGLLNDERYALLWLRLRLSLKKGQSPQQLLISLLKRGIDRVSSQNALKTVLTPEIEYIMLLDYVEKNSSSANAKFLKSELKSEGFSAETIARYFDE